MSHAAKLVSVNVGLPRPVSFDGQEITTGICKEPVEGRVRVDSLGLEGDGQADLASHGGVDKAVYAYSLADTAHWREVLRRPELGPGSLGENLSLDDLSDDRVALGDVLRVGDTVLQVTQPRQPCVKLAMKLGLPRFPKQFTRSGRIGFYLRVIEEGTVAAGDELVCIDREDDPLSVRALNAGLLLGEGGETVLRRALASPALSGAWRFAIERRLDRR